MFRQPPRSPSTDTHFPYTPLFRALERVPHHLSPGRGLAQPPDCTGGLPQGLDRQPGVPQRPDLLRHRAAARAAPRRSAVLLALFVPRARPARAARPLRRLLGAERRPHADQTRTSPRHPTPPRGPWPHTRQPPPPPR